MQNIDKVLNFVCFFTLIVCFMFQVGKEVTGGAGIGWGSGTSVRLPPMLVPYSTPRGFSPVTPDTSVFPLLKNQHF